jgi:hypothetical protein
MTQSLCYSSWSLYCPEGKVTGVDTSAEVKERIERNLLGLLQCVPWLSLLVMLDCCLRVVFSLPRSCCHMVDSITTSALSAVSLNTSWQVKRCSTPLSLFQPCSMVCVLFDFCWLICSFGENGDEARTNSNVRALWDANIGPEWCPRRGPEDFCLLGCDAV